MEEAVLSWFSLSLAAFSPLHTPIFTSIFRPLRVFVCLGGCGLPFIYNRLLRTCASKARG